MNSTGITLFSMLSVHSSEAGTAVKIILFQRLFDEGMPSAKNMRAIAPLLVGRGIELEVYCWESGPEIAGVRIRKLSRWAPASAFDDWVFALAGMWKSACLRLSRREEEHTVLLSTDQYAVFADASLVHFGHFDWLGWQLRVPCRTAREMAKALLESVFCAAAGAMICWNPWMRKLVTNSEGLERDLKRYVLPGTEVRAIPNTVLIPETSPQIVAADRRAVREELGIGPEEKVFCYCGMGHFRRKGLWLALEAVARLRQRTGADQAIRFLLIGGTPRALEDVARACRQRYADMDQWLSFTGSVRDVLRRMSACDAFLFPSYSDSFCRVAYEAAGLGLRSYLTPFQGALALLRGYANAREIPWDVEEITSVLQQDLERGLVCVGEGNRSGFSSPETYARALASYLFPGTDEEMPSAGMPSVRVERG